MEQKKAMKVICWITDLLKLLRSETIILKFQQSVRFDITILLQDDTGYNTVFKKSRFLLQDTKEMNCPANIIFRDVIFFPEFKVSYIFL